MNRPIHEAEGVAASADCDHLTICFRPDGSMRFYSESSDPKRLAGRLAEAIELLFNNPEMIPHAAGHHEHS